MNVQGCVLDDHPLTSALLEHDQVSAKMYLLADQAFGPASSVGDDITRFLASLGNRLKHATLVKCDLQPVADF